MSKKPSNQKEDPEGYPSYPSKEDVYAQFKEEQSVDPDDGSEKEEVDSVEDETELGDEKMGTDLDVPGSELDDDQEEVGSEDEENNYYSLGGEKDLEESHGGEDI